MDTGFRRYDGSLMPVRRPDRTFTFIFSGNSIENTCAEMIRATNSHPVPSYPRKRVSKLVLPKTNLDSRLRGNDKSRRGACKGNFLQLSILWTTVSSWPLRGESIFCVSTRPHTMAWPLRLNLSEVFTGSIDRTMKRIVRAQNAGDPSDGAETN
jgi:hypothetical protein